MEWYYKNILVWLLVLLSIAACTGDTCAKYKDTSCIALHDCQVLFERLIHRRSKDLVQLLRNLHCGFYDMEEPMVCCPPHLVKSSIAELPRFNPLNLLPDMSVCGMAMYVQIKDRIVGGIQTDIDEHPWMALIYSEDGSRSGFHCGGVLITSRYVLTAAHCVKGADYPENFKITAVRLGEWNVTSERDCFENECSPPVLDILVEEVIAHEDYDPVDLHQQNDIALLRLNSEVTFTDFVKPICLPISSEVRNKNFDNLTMEVAGWGNTVYRTDYEIYSEVKLKVRVPVVSRNKCNRVYNKVNRIITKNQLCAGGLQGQDSCKGDSGGPLMGQVNTYGNWMVIGIVSYGPTPCGTRGWPGVYTQVTEYIDWILSNMRP